MFRLGGALRGAARLVYDPFDFGGAMLIFHAFAETRLLRSAYARILKDLTPAERVHLEMLTRREVDVEALSRLPANTLGHALGTLFRTGAEPDAQLSELPELAETFEHHWEYLRFCRVHDFHHVLLDFAIDAHGEMGLQAFNLRNFGEPFGALAMLSAPVTALRYGDPARLAREIARGWRTAAAVPNLFVVPFEEWYEDDLDEVRRRVGLARA